MVQLYDCNVDILLVLLVLHKFILQFIARHQNNVCFHIIVAMSSSVNEPTQDILLKRAADALETFYSFPRPQNHNGGQTGHIGSLIYPGSPALFALTPQMSHMSGPLLSPTRKGHSLASMHGGGGGENNTNEVCVNGQQQESGGSGFFTFPAPGHPEVKLEHMPPSFVYKPKPMTPSSQAVYPMAMPFLQVTPPSSYGRYPNVPNSSMHPDMNGFMNEDDNRNNNNNSNTNAYSFGYPMIPANWAGNSIHLIPPSPGFFMAPTGMSLIYH